MRMRYMALQAQWGGEFTVARNSKIDCKLSRKEVILSREEHIADERCIPPKRSERSKVMLQNMPTLGAGLIAVMVIAWVGILVTPAFAENAFVEVTGQTTSYADG